MTIIRGIEMSWEDLPGRLSADPLVDIDAASSTRYVKLWRIEGRTAHRHPHSEEVILVVAGTGRVYVDGEFTPVAPGDLVHVPATAAHATVPDEGVEMELMCFFPHPDLEQNIEETDITVS